MHFSSFQRPEAAFLLSLLLAPVPVHSMLRCDQIRADSASFDLSALGGPHSVVTSRWHPPAHTNTSYTIDICQPLIRKGNVPKGDKCPNGTRVCAIQRTIKKEEGGDIVSEVIPIAGDLQDSGGKQMDVTYERLKTSESNADSKKEGVRIIMTGGKYPLYGPVKDRKPQKAIIEFICDKEKTGLEGETSPEDEYQKPSRKGRRDDEKKDDEKKDDDKKDDDNKDGDKDEGESTEEKQNNKDGASLMFNSYDASEKSDIGILRLTWYTKYACEDASKNPSGGDDDPAGNASSHWGFFTWFVIIAFLGIATYLIFGSWLNYNRYGARGWDLLPHGDTIRDIPYLFKDWTRSVLNSVQGSGSRGGYSAV